MYDLKIINAQVPDFENNAFYQTDLAIKDGKIVKLGSDSEDSKVIFDAKGQIVSPGFIDIHSHEENIDSTLEDPFYTGYCALRMGVTTLVGGNCGDNKNDMDFFVDYLTENGAPVNYMMFLGHNYLRNQVGIEDRYRKATSSEIKKMKELIKDNLKHKVVGISYGIEYSPGVDMNEMVEIASALDSDDYLLSAHYRYDGDKSVESVEELVELSKRTKLPMQISHIGSCSAMGTMKETLLAIENAIDEGADILVDCYPYAAFSTYIGSAVFDEGCFERWGKTYSDILLTEKPYQGMRCDKELYYKAKEEYPDSIVAAFVMNEEEVREALKAPFVMIGSDALFNYSMGHPRGAGSFAKVLGQYVREEQLFPLIEGLKKMTMMPAQRLNLKYKGQIFEGADADLVIFDPETIRDEADFSSPTKAPTGIEMVVVNGEIALMKNNIINSRLGKYIRKESSEYER